MTKKQLLAKAKQNQKVVDFIYEENGTNHDGYVEYKITFQSPPKNYKLVHVDVSSKCAVLEDLDYVKPSEIPSV